MASRRMFNKSVVESAKFIKLAENLQLLYFHLGMNADDDGVVEAYIVLRAIKAKKEELIQLEKLGYIKILNDDYVCHITDWLENNNIRQDRKQDSIYSDLLQKNGIVTLEKKPRKDVEKTKEARRLKREQPPMELEDMMLGSSAELIAMVREWLQYKQEKRQTYKPTGLKALITQVQNNSQIYGETTVIELINMCMSNGWQGIIWDRLKKITPKGDAVDRWINQSSAT